MPSLFVASKSVTAGEDEIVHLHLRTNPEDASLKDILERILTGVIVFEPLARLMLIKTDLKSDATRVVVAPERRHQPFIVPRR